MTARRPSRARRRAAALAALLPLLIVTVAVLAACGGEEASQLVVSLAASQGADTVKPGDTVQYVVSVVNKGPGAATNVHLGVTLPADFHYQATPDIEHDIVGAPRTQVTDPQPKATAPAWGTWDLAAPTTNADGTDRLSNVDVTFTVTAGGDPGDYQLEPKVSSDQDAISGAGVAVHLQPAPSLTVDVSADRSVVTRGNDVLYRVTVDNFGTGPAKQVGVLVTLPEGLTYLKTQQVAGNASRDSPVDPVVGTLEAFFGGFTIPAQASGSPGSLILTVRAHCGLCAGGASTVSVQVTDADGLVVQAPDKAPVQVIAPPASTPPPPTARPTPVPTVAPLPTLPPLPTAAPVP